jgi:hypothetical protein
MKHFMNSHITRTVLRRQPNPIPRFPGYETQTDGSTVSGIGCVMISGNYRKHDIARPPL